MNWFVICINASLRISSSYERKSPSEQDILFWNDPNAAISEYNLSRGQLTRLWQYKIVYTSTLDKLLSRGECDITEIMKHTPDYNKRGRRGWTDNLGCGRAFRCCVQISWGMRSAWHCKVPGLRQGLQRLQHRAHTQALWYMFAQTVLAFQNDSRWIGAFRIQQSHCGRCDPAGICGCGRIFSIDGTRYLSACFLKFQHNGCGKLSCTSC